MRALSGTGTSAGRKATSRLSSSRSRISGGAAASGRNDSRMAEAPSPRGDSPSPGGSSPVAVSAPPSPQAVSRTGEQTLDDWLVLWEERAEQIAYRLSLIDGQFEALIRKREVESASTTPPPIRQTIESLAQLFPEF